MATHPARKILLFGAAGLAAALASASGAARAQAYMPGSALTQAGNVVGGGGATIAGGGDDMVIAYSRGGAGGGASYEQPGRTATFAGSDGGKPVWTYTYGPAPNTNPGREAWLTGGGDNAEVEYYSSRR